MVLVIVYGVDPQVGQSLDGHFFSLYSILCLCNSFHGCFVPPSKKDQSIHTLVFLLLEFHVFLPVPDKYRSGCSQSSIGLITGSPVKELEKEIKELKVFAAP